MVGYQNISLDNILSYSISSDLNDENGLDKDEEIESGNDNDGQLSMLVRSGKSSRKQSSNSLKASLASLKRREAAPKRPPPDVKALECLTMGDLLERQDLPLVVSKSRPVHPKWVILK